MKRITRASGWVAVVLIAGGCGASKPQRVSSAAEAPFPIDQYAEQRRETNRCVTEISQSLRPRLDAGSREEQAAAMKEIAGYVREHIGPHAQEVELLYAYADREAGARYTETMRYQHREIESRIWFLETLAGAAEPDVAMFRSKLTSLVYYMNAHLDTETNTIAAMVVDNELERRRSAGSLAVGGEGR